MGDLEKGLEVVKKACELDHANKYFEALPLYRTAIQSFKAAYNNTSTPEQLKKILIEKIREYEDRAIELQKLIVYLNPITDEEKLMAATISGINLQQTTNQLFPSLIQNNATSLQPQDILMHERIAKLTMKNNIPENKSEDMNSRIAKLNNGISYSASSNTPTINIHEEDIPEEEQIKRILEEAHDSVQLDILSGGYNIKQVEEDNTPPIPEQVHKNREKTKSHTSKKQSKKNNKKHSDSSSSGDEYDSDITSSSSEEDKTKPIDSLKQREKAAIKKMTADEKERKKLAYQKFLKNQYKF